jgi:pimeloyl-ACP methyl ester carboxylesterase
VDRFFKGPFFCFYQTADVDDIERAHTWLLDLLDRYGPYDGVLAFSQGCALVATLMLKIQNRILRSGLYTVTRQSQPFKFAIFICGGLPLPFLAKQGYAVSDTAWRYDRQSGEALSSQASFTALLQNGSERWNHISWTDADGGEYNNGSTDRGGTYSSGTDVFGLDVAQVAEGHKIEIPTVHIYGSRDPRMGSALQLAGLCSSDNAKIACHGGGHDIPRTSPVSDLIAGLIFWAWTQAVDKNS